jgi:hypothetical protein
MVPTKSKSSGAKLSGSALSVKTWKQAVVAIRERRCGTHDFCRRGWQLRVGLARASRGQHSPAGRCVDRDRTAGPAGRRRDRGGGSPPSRPGRVPRSDRPSPPRRARSPCPWERPDKPSESLVILIALTVLSVAPALLLLCTSFTKIFVVLSITRNALGLTSVPPNQVLAGLALFLSLFIMAPTAAAVNEQGIQPFLYGEEDASPRRSTTACSRCGSSCSSRPGRRRSRSSRRWPSRTRPANAEEVPLTTLVPAFVPLRTARRHADTASCCSSRSWSSTWWSLPHSCHWA